MRIVVCIKQVPDTTEVRIDPETNTLIRHGIPVIINPFDENAIEAGLQMKDKNGAEVWVISMGPPQAEEALREALSMGCDKAVLISDRKFAGADTWATAYTLSRAIKKIEEEAGAVDLVFCGKQAFDGDTAQVGPSIADQLDWIQATYAKSFEINNDTITVTRLLEDGHEIVEMKMPAVLTFVKQSNEPRYPSLRGKMAAKKADIPVWDAAYLNAEPGKIGLDGSPTKVVRIFTPEHEYDTRMLGGEVPDMVRELISCLRKEKLF